MSYLIMVMLGFIMIGIGTVGYLNSNVIVKSVTDKTTYLVDGNGNTVSQINGGIIFEKYKLTLKEKL